MVALKRTAVLQSDFVGLAVCVGRQEGGCEGVSGPRHVDGREGDARCHSDARVAVQEGTSCAELDNDGCPNRSVE